MKITFFFRSKGYSIEMVFSTIINTLKEKNIDLEIINIKHSNATLKSIISNILQAKKYSGEINHITGDIHYISLLLPRKNTILTIHDCVMMYRVPGIKKWLFRLLWLTIPVNNARFVTAISSKTKEDILRFTKCPLEKIVIIPNPVDPKFTHTPSTFNKKKPRILHFANVEHKNTDRVIAALENLNIDLILIGKSTPKELQGKNITSLFNLSNEEILEQYILCDIVLFPSWFEGFGMPIIEGQAVGRVVITSNIEPMTEVAGDGAHFVDPFDVESIRNGIIKVIEDSAYRNALIQLGLENVKKYQVDVIAQMYLNIYNQIEKEHES